MKIFMEEMKEVKEMKLKIVKEIWENEIIKSKILFEVIEKERQTYLKELKEIKELIKHEIESIRKLRREKDDEESEEEIAEFNWKLISWGGLLLFAKIGGGDTKYQEGSHI